jgi:hypothetical protein
MEECNDEECGRRERHHGGGPLQGALRPHEERMGGRRQQQVEEYGEEHADVVNAPTAKTAL